MVEAFVFGKPELTVRLAGVLGKVPFSALLVGDGGRTKPLLRPIVELGLGNVADPMEEAGREEGRFDANGLCGP